MSFMKAVAPDQVETGQIIQRLAIGQYTFVRWKVFCMSSSLQWAKLLSPRGKSLSAHQPRDTFRDMNSLGCPGPCEQFADPQLDSTLLFCLALCPRAGAVAKPSASCWMSREKRKAADALPKRFEAQPCQTIAKPGPFWSTRDSGGFIGPE